MKKRFLFVLIVSVAVTSVFLSKATQQAEHIPPLPSIAYSDTL